MILVNTKCCGRTVFSVSNVCLQTNSSVSVSFTCRRCVCQVDSPQVLPQPLQLLLLLLVLSLCLMNRTSVKDWTCRQRKQKTHTHTLTSCLRSLSYSGRYSLKEEEKDFSLTTQSDERSCDLTHSPLVLLGSVLHLNEELVQSTSCHRRHPHHLQTKHGQDSRTGLY